MSDRRLLDAAIADMARNPQQLAAVSAKGHCVLLAGPGSGKTKTLTTAMARCLLEDVEEPRGIACITYNNECAIELESRLKRLNIEPNDRIFIGTVHSFALTRVVMPYGRCVLPDLPENFRLATKEEKRLAVQLAYEQAIGDEQNPHERWGFAEVKRRRDVDRTHPDWRSSNPEFADLIEAYEVELRKRGLIDFDDMPLLALRMIREHEWIRRSLRAKYPVLFVDEYQDMGHALHEIVLSLCLDAGIRIFAVGDPDQSIYAFTGAKPQLLEDLAIKTGATPIHLQFNYRCGNNIIQASMAALGEERQYQAVDTSAMGIVHFNSVPGNLDDLANFVFTDILPTIQDNGTPLEQIAVLYREAWMGEKVAAKGLEYHVPIVRADGNALVRRSCKVSRFIEACARWVTGGWKDADPPFRRLAAEAVALVVGVGASQLERQQIEQELIGFLRCTIDQSLSTHEWLLAFRDEVLQSWRHRSRTILDDWAALDAIIEKTAPTSGNDMPLAHFGGRIEGAGQLNLSTLHSAKGREFDAVIMFGMNQDVFPNRRDNQSAGQLKEARRLFYVGVTRARKELYILFNKGQFSPWVRELHQRTKQVTQ